MRILYVGRHDGTGIQGWLKRQQRLLSFGEQDGFFEASLYAGSDVTEMSFARFVTQPSVANQYDALVINNKCGGSFKGEGDRATFFKQLLREVHVTRALFIGAARASMVPSDALLDVFDTIFKREPYRDRDRYDISSVNKTKIVPTMISCPFLIMPRPTLRSRVYARMLPQSAACKTDDRTYDVGFSGAVASAHTLRESVWGRMVDEGFRTIGGLQPNPYTKEPVPAMLAGKRLKGKRYREALCSAKINLALDGIGEYTFRHQELLYLGSFMISSPSIRDVELPMPLEENKQYVAFDDRDDLVDKIRYYLSHDEERKKIARAGQSLFETYYAPKQHAKTIRTALGR